MRLEKAINPLLDDNDQVAFSFILENIIAQMKAIENVRDELVEFVCVAYWICFLTLNYYLHIEWNVSIVFNDTFVF